MSHLQWTRQIKADKIKKKINSESIAKERKDKKEMETTGRESNVKQNQAVQYKNGYEKQQPRKESNNK